MNTPRQYGFHEELKASEGVSESASIERILIENICGAVGVNKAATVNDRSGTDWWVEHCTGRHLSVDAKVRKEDWAASHPDEDDLALETWSVVEKEVIGWTRDQTKRCDFVIWLWTDSGRWCLLPFPMLCKVFQVKWQHWSAKFKTRRQFTPQFGGYHSECVFVPRREIWAEMYKHYSGQLEVTT